jgi:HK97 family phage major capsid protein
MNLTRSVTIVIDEEEPETDEIELAISSETPYERFYGIEILGHKAAEVDLTRLNDGRHPLLMDHDLTRQVGVVTGAAIGEDAVLRGRARFSARADAQDALRDVRDGIKTLVSVGYMVEEMQELKRSDDGQDAVVRTLSWAEFESEQRALHGDQFYRAGPPAARAKGDKPPVYRVTRWVPFEASLVAVPADATVGVGRSADLAAVQQQQPQPQPATPAVTPEPRKEIRMDQQQKDPAVAERERVSAIIEAGSKHGKYVGQKDIDNAIRNGHTVEQFRDFVWGKIETSHTDTSELQLGMTKKEAQRYSFGRAIVAAITGDWSQAGLEREASAAMAKLTGRSPEGFFVPFDIFRRDFNVGTSSEAGNFVATDLRGDLYVDALRNAMVMAGLGVRFLPGLTSNIDMPRKSVPSTLAMLSEIGSASESQPTTAKVTLSPKRISAYVEVSKQAMIQSFMSLENMIRDDLITGAAVLLENQSINGNGTAPNILGLRNVSGIGTVVAGANGLAPTWGHFVDLESVCANANAEPDRLAGYLINTRTRGRAKQVQKGTNLAFLWDGGAQPLNGYRAAVTNNVPSNLTKGTSTTVCSAAMFGSDWSMAVLGLFGAPDVVIDPYTKADTGQVKITLNQFADFGVRQPGAFAKVDDLLAG